MSLNVHCLDAHREIPAELRAKVLLEIEQALTKIGRLLPLSKLDVVLIASRRLVMPEQGLGAYAINPGLVHVTLDPAHPEIFAPERPQRLMGLMAHEIHHVIRMRGPGYGRTLGEALVSVGLATTFEEEIGCPTPFYATIVRGEALEVLAERARLELDHPGYDHPTWFFGSRTDAAFPRHGGYSLGHAIVKAWLQQSRQTPSRAVRLAAGEILDCWRQNACAVG